MYKQAKPISLSLPFVRIMVRKRAIVRKYETHKAKLGRVVNLGRYMVAFFPKSSYRCPSASLRVS